MEKTIIKQLMKIQEQEKQARQALVEIAARRRGIIIRLNEAGFSYPKIASIYGVSRQRIEQIVKRDRQ